MNSKASVLGFLASTVIILTLLSACQEGDGTLLPAQDFSQFNNFDKLKIASGFRTTIRQGTTRQVRVSVASPDQAKLYVTQNNGTLSIGIDNRSSQLDGSVEITMPTLAGLDLSGVVTATVTGFQTGSLPISIKGNSSLTLTGSGQELILTLMGGSSFNGYGFPVEKATVILSGGSEARVAASQTLTVTASGGSKLFYQGMPTLTKTLTGDSSITKE